MREVVLGIVAGVGIGFFLGQVWILYKQRKGYMLPVNPYALPLQGEDPQLRTVMTPAGARTVKEKAPVKGKVIVPKEDQDDNKNGSWR